MGNLRLKGGIHTYGGKEYTEEAAIKPFFPTQGQMCYPLLQHIGLAAAPCVSPGDRVLAGQIIGQAQGAVSAHVLSSVSGTVLAVEPRQTITGELAECVVIENDGKYEKAPGVGQERDWRNLSPEEILSAVKEAGIVGLGGAGFPTHVKLNPPSPQDIEYLLVNGAECEPYLTGDYRHMMERGPALIEGCQVILKLFPNARCVIGIEDNKPRAVEYLSRLAKDHDNIRVQPLVTRYPQGSERTLIRTITGRNINAGELPYQVGCIVSNSTTVAAVADAVCRGQPLLTKVITVTGDAAASPCNLEVPLGVSFAKVLEFAGGLKKKPEKLISGGPMTGHAIATLDAPVVKTSTSILCLSIQEAREFEEENCIRCGRCSTVCPERLMPMLLDDTTLRGDCRKFIRQYGMECVECGCCSYVCPARRRLAERFSRMKVKTRQYVKEQSHEGKQHAV